MSITSKTGLLPTSQRKNVEHEFQGSVMLEMPKLVVPAPFSLRPFAGIYNPFPYGCSILCNHPTDFEAKSLVKKAKNAWATEGKSLLDLEEVSVLRLREKVKREHESLPPDGERDDNVPEELFRKYTDTDSRPITPTPTLASIVTKKLRTRRCVTPDPISFLPAKEKTLLVLDLRRSHSQETVCWQGQLDDPNIENDLHQYPISRAPSPPSPNPAQTKRKKSQKKKPGSPTATISSLKTQTSKDSDSKLQMHSSVSQSPSKGSVIQEQESSSKTIEIRSEADLEDTNIIKRRGKKPKKGKRGKGEKEFQGIPDPGETQVSALENESKEGSSRQSLTEEEKSLEKKSEENLVNLEVKPDMDEDSISFLSRDTLKQLQRQLDQEVVDSEQNVQRKVALEEALKHKKNPKHSQQGEEMKNLKREFQLLIKDSEKWLSIPRVFTRRSARFELPMDSRMLNNMTPMQYIEKYVFVSPERLVLYNHIFNLFKEDPEDDEERDRIMLGKNVVNALGKVMGRSLTASEAEELKLLLKWKDEAGLNFRSFAGISATCERLMSPQFCSKMSTQREDPRHEIEQADFESLNEKLLRLHPDSSLVKILQSIRDV